MFPKPLTNPSPITITHALSPTPESEFLEKNMSDQDLEQLFEIIFNTLKHLIRTNAVTAYSSVALEHYETLLWNIMSTYDDETDDANENTYILMLYYIEKYLPIYLEDTQASFTNFLILILGAYSFSTKLLNDFHIEHCIQTLIESIPPLSSCDKLIKRTNAIEIKLCDLEYPNKNLFSAYKKKLFEYPLEDPAPSVEIITFANVGKK